MNVLKKPKIRRWHGVTCCKRRWLETGTFPAPLLSARMNGPCFAGWGGEKNHKNCFAFLSLEWLWGFH